jgi:hypothetical protein
MEGQWFSLGTPVSSTNKADRQDITEILLTVVLNIITLTIFTFYFSVKAPSKDRRSALLVEETGVPRENH